MDYQIIELEEFNVIGIRYELSKSLSNNVKFPLDKTIGNAL